MKKISVAILVLMGIFLVYKCRASELHSTKEIQKEVDKYSFDYTLKDKDGAKLSLEGKQTEQKDWYFIDNEFDFEFYATSQTTYSNGINFFIAYWQPYMTKAFEVLKEDAEDCIKEQVAEVFEVSKVEFYYSRDLYSMNFNIYGKTTENYTEEKWDEKIVKASEKICDIIVEKYDSRFRERELKNGWFDWQEEGFCFGWYPIDENKEKMFLGFYDLSSKELWHCRACDEKY